MIFTLVEQRYQINGKELARARDKCGLNQSEFAYQCGWSPQYQWSLENSVTMSISEGTKKVIEDVLNRAV